MKLRWDSAIVKLGCTSYLASRCVIVTLAKECKTLALAWCEARQRPRICVGLGFHLPAARHAEVMWLVMVVVHLQAMEHPDGPCNVH